MDAGTWFEPAWLSLIGTFLLVLVGTAVAVAATLVRRPPDRRMTRWPSRCRTGGADRTGRRPRPDQRLSRNPAVTLGLAVIAANASIDGNRGAEWLAGEVDRMLVEAEHVDAVEDRAAVRGQLLGAGDRVPAGLADPQDRRARIRAAARVRRR